MNKKMSVLCVGKDNDMRMLYTAESLADRFKVYYLSDICTLQAEKITLITELSGLDKKFDILLLPMNGSDELNINSGKKTYSFGEISKSIQKNGLVLGGRLSISQIEYFSALGFEVYDYFNREELVIKNCIPTAEGALQIAMQEISKTVNGLKVMITGYGRVAKATAKLFKSCGAETDVFARRVSQLAWAENDGFKAYKLDKVGEKICHYDLIINTVPAMIFTGEILKEMNKDALIIDLASKPGGVDFASAKSMNKRVIHALALPGKVAPITAGEIIGETVVNIINEHFIVDFHNK